MSRRKKAPIRRKRATRRSTPSRRKPTTRASETKVTVLPPELLAPPDTQPQPPVAPRTGVLPLHQLTWPDFERLLVAIANDVLGLCDARLYGVAGQAQHGLDVIARTTQGEPRALQGKNVKSFSKGALQKAISKFAKGKRPFDCRWIAIAVACNVDRTEIVDELHRLRCLYPNLTIELWGENQLSALLRNHAHLVRRYFGTEWERIFCDPSTASSSQQHTNNLRALLTSSRARLLARWLAAGVEEGDAGKFADDATIGIPPPLKDSLPETGLICVEGEFGTGKSVFGERTHQLDVIAVLNNIRAPIPIHFTARFIQSSLEAAIRSESASLGVVHLVGARVVIDGLDEPGLDRANDLIEQAQVIVRSWPQTRIIVTTRPGVIPDTHNRITMPLLTSEEQQALLSRTTGSPQVPHNWPPPVLEAIRRPLFLLIAASLHRDGSQHIFPLSRASFLDALVRKALERTARMATEARSGLLRLATLTLTAGGAVPSGEFGTEGAQEILLNTRLVIRRGKSLMFAIPVIEQYFGAQALLEGAVKIESTLTTLESLDQWRYALVLATNLGSWERVSTLLEHLAARHPGVAVWIVKEAVSEGPIKQDEALPPLPSGDECARRLRCTLTTWLVGFEPASKLLGLTRTDGTPHTVAASRQGTLLAAGLWREENSTSPVDTMELPSTGNSINWRVGRNWLLRQSAQVNSTDTAWPWNWSLHWVAAEVEHLLKEKALPVHPSSPAQAELRWAVAKWMLGERSDIFHKPLPAATVTTEAISLLNYLKTEIDDKHFYISNIPVNTARLRQVATELTLGLGLSADGLMHRPWCTPDLLSPRGNRLSDLYSDETLRRLVEQVYQAALEIYSELVTSWFPKLRGALYLASLLPVRLEGMLEIRRGRKMEQRPRLTYWLYPLQPGETSNATVAIASFDEISKIYQESMSKEVGVQADFSHWRPTSLPRLRQPAWKSWSQTTLFVFKNTPATNLAYKWLWREMHQLRLLRNHPPIGED